MTNNPGASAEAIQHHYDVSNAFYALWLDDTMSYSAAIWEDGDSFEEAQRRKLDFHTNQARASGAKRVLDVGCGWGALARHLVEEHSVEKVVGLTLSPRQAEWIASYDLPQIEVRVESWSDHVPEAPYDAITSMGAFEHFARPLMSEEERVRGYRSFFQCCHDWLNPGGWISLETVSYENASREDLSQFFLTEIYPESDLPTLADIAKACERIFEIVRLRNDRLDAAQTWRAWLAGLRNHRAEAVELVGEEMVDHYEKYLKYSIIGNHTGTMGQLRMAMRRIDRPRA